MMMMMMMMMMMIKLTFNKIWQLQFSSVKELCSEESSFSWSQQTTYTDSKKVKGQGDYSAHKSSIISR